MRSIFVFAIAAAEAVVGLALSIAIFRHRRTIDLDRINARNADTLQCI